MRATVDRLLTAGGSWADVGCGRHVFPSNPRLAKKLCSRASYVVGIDPDPNVLENPFVTERFRGMIEDYPAQTRVRPDHTAWWPSTSPPPRALSKIASMLTPGGRTVYKKDGAPVSAALLQV